MLEILIILSLALALFLMLRNFPLASNEPKNEEGEEMGLLNNLFKKREEIIEEIQEEIKRGQEDVVAPVEINMAQQRYMEHNPEIAKMLYAADQALAAEDLREAEEKALEAIMKDKRSAQAYVILGKISRMRGDFDDAKEAFKTAIKCNPELGEAYYGLGDMYLKNESYAEAIEYLQKAVILERGQPEWHASLGKAYLEVRQFAKASKAFKRAANLDIDNKEYRDLAIEAEEKYRSHSHVPRAK
ncbi:MAG: tetratricopeptide repeat protein [bacterium ADurb.Bin400]|nr:MAG: tetratricopeptide repeat protein [bacterium ADurb.Bin400]